MENLEKWKLLLSSMCLSCLFTLFAVFCGWLKVVSFDGSMTVSEFLVSLEKSIGVRESSSSGFALFSDDPTEPVVEHHLQADAKVSC